jgi:hypothetical protein
VCTIGPLLPSSLSVCLVRSVPFVLSVPKTQHFGFSNIRFRRRPSFKSVYVIVVVAVGLHHQQSDNFCKIQKENAEWTWTVIYVRCFIVFLSSGAPCLGVYYTSLRARGRVHCRCCWLLILLAWHTLTSILFMRHTGRNWTTGLVTAGCFALLLWLWHPWFSFTTFPIWTYITWHPSFVAVRVKNQFRYFAGPQQPWPLAWSTHYSLATTRNDCEMLTDKKQRTLTATLRVNMAVSLRNETWHLQF